MRRALLILLVFLFTQGCLAQNEAKVRKGVEAAVERARREHELEKQREAEKEQRQAAQQQQINRQAQQFQQAAQNMQQVSSSDYLSGSQNFQNRNMRNTQSNGVPTRARVRRTQSSQNKQYPRAFQPVQRNVITHYNMNNTGTGGPSVQYATYKSVKNFQPYKPKKPTRKTIVPKLQKVDIIHPKHPGEMWPRQASNQAKNTTSQGTGNSNTSHVGNSQSSTGNRSTTGMRTTTRLVPPTVHRTNNPTKITGNTKANSANNGVIKPRQNNPSVQQSNGTKNIGGQQNGQAQGGSQGKTVSSSATRPQSNGNNTSGQKKGNNSHANAVRKGVNATMGNGLNKSKRPSTKSGQTIKNPFLQSTNGKPSARENMHYIANTSEENRKIISQMVNGK